MKPILFNTEMARAILRGRKTVTRRLIKKEKAPVLYEVNEPPKTEWLNSNMMSFRWSGKTIGGFDLRSPYRIRDILYVRETWAAWSRTEGTTPEIHYKADGEELKGVKWKPSIHMPKEAARIFLRVTDVKARRLMDMTIDDIKAEGVHPLEIGTEAQGYYEPQAYFEAFEAVWDSTIEKSDLPLYGWDANPWVWVIEFEMM